MTSSANASTPSFPAVADYERLARFETVLNLRDMKTRARMKVAAVALLVAATAALIWIY